MATAAMRKATAPEEGHQEAPDLLGLFNRAQQLLEAQKGGDALLPLKEILQHRPNHPDAYNLTSVAFGQLGMLGEAEAASRQAIALKPNDTGYHLNLANRLNDQRRIDEAVVAYEKALSLEPNHVATLRSYMSCLANARRWIEAYEVVGRLVTLVGDEPETLANCGEICIRAGDRQQALRLFRKAVDHNQDELEWHVHIARLAAELLEYPLAMEQAEYVLQREENAEMRVIIAGILHSNKRLAEVTEHLDHIPDDSVQAANAANLRGMTLVSQAKINEGLEIMSRTKRLAPKTFALQATRVMYLNYAPDQTRESLREAHLDFGARFKDYLSPLSQKVADQRFDPERKLRIGFVSPDLRAHSVAYFAMPFFHEFDRNLFDVIGYAHVAKEDVVTATLREHATDWRSIVNWNEKKLADEVRKDRIDILIDMAGLTANTRLLAFTARPAPIQMTYIGYPNTTGLPQIDYRLTDWITDPEGADDDYSETLIRLPECFLCYAPPTHAPDLEPGPCESRNDVTFGSFNNFAKINPEVLKLWSDVLHAVPNSRLLLKSTSSGDPTAQSVIRETLAERGIGQERVEFADYRSAPANHMAIYNDIDIALDTFPYNGTTTTCEALWMGVPVITLLGNRHASRVTASLLNSAGFTAGIASSPEEYVLTAKLMAEHRGVLKTTRRTLRETMYQSPLCDMKAHVRTLEDAFRAAWKIRCEQVAN